MPAEGGTATKIVAFDNPSVRVAANFTIGPDRLFFTIAEFESDIYVADLDW